MNPNPSLSTSSPTSKYVATTVEHPRLSTFRSAFIRVILRAHDHYDTKIKERARQLVVQDINKTKAITPVNHKFCVDTVWLEPLTILGFIPDLSCNDDLADRQLQTFLDQKTQECKEAVTFDTLDDIVACDLYTDMTNANATSRIEILFVQYITVQRRNELS